VKAGCATLSWPLGCWPSAKYGATKTDFRDRENPLFDRADRRAFALRERAGRPRSGRQGIRAFIVGFSDFLSSPDWQADTASTARAILAELLRPLPRSSSWPEKILHRPRADRGRRATDRCPTTAQVRA
jgi:hypothetical protein